MPLLFLLLVGATAAAPSAETLHRDASAAYARGDVKAAGALACGALKRFGDSDDPWVWKLRFVCSNALMNQGKADEARDLLQRTLPAQLTGTDIEVLRLQGLAMAARRLSDRGAQNLIVRAYDLAKKHPRTLPMLLVYRASIDEANRGKWAREALKLARQYKDADAERRARATIARDLADHQRFDEAIAMWEPAVRQAQKIGDVSMVQKLEGSLGWAYLELGDYETAGDFLTRAHASATKIGAQYDAVVWTYQLGNVRLQQGDLAAAEKHYRAALDLAKQHNQRPIILSYLANYALKTGKIAEAQQYCDESLRERKDEGKLRSLLMAGRIATAAGKFDESEQLLKDVLERTGWSSTKSEAHGRLAQLYVKKGDFSAAKSQFDLSIDIAREARKDITNEELRFSFFTAVEELFDSYVDFLIARGRDADALAVSETSRAETLEEGMTDAVPPRDVRTIARDTGATILCYWIGGTRSYLWIVTPKEIKAVSLPPRQAIDAAIDAYQRDLLGAAGSLRLSGARGIALWKMLIEPASREIAPQSRVIIVPHGRLAAFNMETLVVPTPKPHYWIEDVVISTAGSLELLGRKSPKRTNPSRLLLVGNPPAAPEFAALPHARSEMDKVARHFKRAQSVVLSGAKATPSAYRAQSPGTFTNLHFVAHGVATRLKPLDSAVVLAREGETFKLYARDIAEQPLHARLVTISSCHGAGTRTYAGEGLVGLGWAFLRAGADNVVAALWEVNDAATPDLMDRFYASLGKGTDPATSLRDAKLTLVRGDGVYARPLYWAPFLLYGSS